MNMFKTIKAMISAGTAIGLFALSALVAHGQTPIIGITVSPTAETGAIVYNIAVHNGGDVAANDVFVRTTLDASQNFESSEPPADISSTTNGQMTLTWAVPTISAGATFNLTLRTTVDPAAVGTVVDSTVTVEGDNFPTESATTNVQVGAGLGITPAPTPSPQAFFEPGVLGGADPDSLPTTGVDPWAIVLLAGAVSSVMKWRRVQS